MECLISNFGFRPRTDLSDWGRHIFRELNTEADKLAGRHRYHFQEHSNDTSMLAYRLFFDGSRTSTGTGGGWVLYGSRDGSRDASCDWERLADLSFQMDASATVTACELEAALFGMDNVHARFTNFSNSARAMGEWTPLNFF